MPAKVIRREPRRAAHIDQKIMEQYQLSKKERLILQLLNEGKFAVDICAVMNVDDQRAYASALMNRGLVKAKFNGTGAHELYFIVLTEKGVRYLKENPILRNPVNYQWIMAMIALLSLIVAFLAWVTRCGD